MWKDTIVDDVRKIREAYARRFNFDLDAIAKDLKAQEKTSGLKFVRLRPRRIPKKKVRQGWTESCQRMAENGDDTLL